MPGTLVVRLANRIDEIQRMHTALEEFSRIEEVSPEYTFWLELSLEELITNVILYAWDDGAKHEFEVRMRFDGKSIMVDIVDDGKPFDPTKENVDTGLDGDLQDMRIGGNGIAIVREKMDEMTYKYEDGKNHLTVIKHVDGAG